MKRAVCFLAVLFVLFFSFVKMGLAEDEKLSKDESFRIFLKDYNKGLKAFEKVNKVWEWLEYDQYATTPGEIMDEEGNTWIQVFLEIDHNGYFPRIPHGEKLIISVILAETEEEILASADRAVRATIGTYAQFIDEQKKLGNLKEPSKELMEFFNIFFPRFKEMTRGEYGYNEILGWKVLFPVEKEGKIELTVETVNYKKSKSFNASLALNEEDRIKEGYQLVETVIDWLHFTLLEGLSSGAIKAPSCMAISFNGQCWGDCL